jgi:hypothetical protein
MIEIGPNLQHLLECISVCIGICICGYLFCKYF